MGHSQEVFIDDTNVPLAFSCRQEVINIDFVIRTQQQRNSAEMEKKKFQYGICITLDAL